MEDLTGKQFGSYRVVGPLGEGGMAAVYKAYQASMDRFVALKVLPQYFARDPEFVGRFAQEARMLAKLQHLHILPVFDYGETDGYTYIVMPLVETGTLSSLIKGEPLPLSQIQQIISQVGSALSYAHSQGVVHRDVKPSNVLVDRQGNCLLTDFGIAKMVEGTMAFTQTGAIIGTPAYMSPEQILGEKLDGRSDIYSMGVVLYEMATGRPPFQAETPPAIFVKHLNDPLPPPHVYNPNIPEGVERVILKALSKGREDRFETMDEMVDALTRGIADKVPPTPTRRPDVKPELPLDPTRWADTEAAVPSMKDRSTKDRPVRKKRRIPIWGWGLMGCLALMGLVVAMGVALLVFGGLAGDDEVAAPTITVSATETVADSASEPATEEAPTSPPEGSPGEAIYEEGVRLLEEEEWLGAMEKFDEALDSGWESAELRHDRGLACHQLVEEGRCSLARAVDDYTRAIELGLTEEADLYADRGWAYQELEQFESAIADFSRAIELDPENPETWGARGDGYITLGDFEAALNDYNNATGLDPDNGEYYWSRAISYDFMGELELALDDYSKAIELGVEDSWLYSDRASIYSDLGMYELAIADWTAAIEMEPEGPWYLSARGQAYLELGDFEAALADQTRAIEMAPDDGYAHAARADTYERMGRIDLAIDDWTAAIKREPGDPWYWGSRAWAYDEAGLYGEARADFEELLNLIEGDPFYATLQTEAESWLAEH